MTHVEQVVLRMLIHQVAHSVADLLHVLGNWRKEAGVQRMRETKCLNIADHDLRRRSRRPICHWPARGVKHSDAVLDGLAIRDCRGAHEVVGVHLHWLATRSRHDPWHQRANAIYIEYACRVVEEDGVDARNCSHLSNLIFEQLIGVHRRLSEKDSARDFRTELLGHLGQTIDVLKVVEHVVDPEGTNTMTVQLSHPRIHQIWWRNAHAHGCVGTHTASDRSLLDLT
ncbi:unannotated protein [freshwater metagenome]|uniref:Unannotated protein n=1 Tax=freshwater metagenome TaxID=449393 RepID=A0A6J7IQ83_9ZZZZ